MFQFFLWFWSNSTYLKGFIARSFCQWILYLPISAFLYLQQWVPCLEEFLLILKQTLHKCRTNSSEKSRTFINQMKRRKEYTKIYKMLTLFPQNKMFIKTEYGKNTYEYDTEKKRKLSTIIKIIVTTPGYNITYHYHCSALIIWYCQHEWW